jgi:transcriptional regulator with XRE-family HTH domain
VIKGLYGALWAERERVFNMSARPLHGRDSEYVLKLRQESGKWLRGKREAAGLSQRQLAEKVGFEFYTFVSQIESGRGRVPPERYGAYAVALDVPAREFAMSMMRYNDPITYSMIFDNPQAAGERSPAVVSDLEERLRRLEAKLGDI